MMLLLQVPYQASVDHSFHEFANTTGETDRTVAVCVCLVLAILVDGYHVSFSPTLGNVPCLPPVIEDSQEFELCFGPKVFQHLTDNFVRDRSQFVPQGFQGFSKLLCVTHAICIFRRILITLVALDFIMYLLLPVVWYHDVADLLVTFY